MKTYKLSAVWMFCLLMLVVTSFTACNNGDDLSTDQYKGGVALNVFGPTPVARGGVLRFLGSGMDKVTGVIIPGCEEITDIEVVSAEEIRVAVPQTAQVGFVVLNTPKGEITTKTKLTYSEPIDLESFSPSVIKAGSVLTVKGEYLNLIKEIIFTDNVIVSDFISQDRNEIKLVVPAEAQTGKIIISDGKEIPNWIYSNSELKITLPSVEAPLDLKNAKPGTKITINGSDLDLVKKIMMPNDDVVKFTIDGNKLSFTIPANATDGEITAIPASGVKVPIAKLNMAIPENLLATPAKELKSGSIIIIKGNNMDVVTSITFPGVEEAINPSSQSASSLQIEMPSMAKSGDLILNTGSGKTAKVSIETAKPNKIVYSPTPVPAGDELSIVGINLDVVDKLIFSGDVTVDVTPVSTTLIKVKVPTTAETGIVAFQMKNGEMVEGPKLTIDKPACAYLPSIPAKIIQGSIIDLEIINGSLLTGVTLDGKAIEYINNKAEKKLTLNIPSKQEGVYPLVLTSSNGTITYNINIVSPEKTIWEGSFNVGGWGGFSALSWGGYNWASVPVNTRMKIYLTEDPAQSYWQLRVANGSWAKLPSFPADQIDLVAGATYYIHKITAEDLDALKNQGGLVLTGCNYTVTKIVFIVE